MFTGIISEIGVVRDFARDGDTRITITTAMDTEALELGASIACSGPCLTVVEKGADWFAVEASAETLRRTTLGAWRAGTRVNLERALTLGQELGGHMVTGHVDGVAEIVAREPEGDSLRFVFAVPEDLTRYIAAKGSVSLDGVSLTVNDVTGARFGVNIIPHTRRCTTFGEVGPGDKVNLEVDLLARYMARLMEGDER